MSPRFASDSEDPMRTHRGPIEEAPRSFRGENDKRHRSCPVLSQVSGEVVTNSGHSGGVGWRFVGAILITLVNGIQI